MAHTGTYSTDLRRVLRFKEELMKALGGGLSLLHLKPMGTLPFISIENLGKYYACLRL